MYKKQSIHISRVKMPEGTYGELLIKLIINKRTEE
jgi:hypothetical protein